MTFSKHFQVVLKVIVVITLILGVVFLWVRRQTHDTPMVPRIILPHSTQELITYNENRHILTVTTAAGTKQVYSRNPAIEIKKDGMVRVSPQTWGLELRPFLGAGYDSSLRIYGGAQMFYFRRFDFSLGLGLATADIVHPSLAVGYNFWSNTSVNIGVNPVSFIGLQKPEITVFVSVRL